MKTLREYVMTPGQARRRQARVPHPGGGRGEIRQIVAARLEQDGGLGNVEGDTVSGTLEGTSHGVGGGASALRIGHEPSIRASTRPVTGRISRRSPTPLAPRPHKGPRPVGSAR